MRIFRHRLSTRTKWDLAVGAACVLYLIAILALDLSIPLVSIFLAAVAAYEWLARRRIDEDEPHCSRNAGMASTHAAGRTAIQQAGTPDAEISDSVTPNKAS